ncbi:MAG: hypothetical protein ACTICC_10680 [Lactiplantibacillus plantarum]
MANLALNGMVHGAALNGKILFDNSNNWQDLGDLKTSSKDMSWVSTHNSIIVGSHMVAKQNDDGSVSIEGYIDFSYWEVDLQTRCTIWTLPDGFTQNGEFDVNTSVDSYTENAFLIRAGTSDGRWPDKLDTIYKVGITNGSLWFAANDVPGRIGIAFFHDVTIPKKIG